MTTSAEVIAYLQTRPNISIDPALIATLITNASAFIKTYINDNLLSQDYIELFDGDNRLLLQKGDQGEAQVGQGQSKGAIGNAVNATNYQARMNFDPRSQTTRPEEVVRLTNQSVI